MMPALLCLIGCSLAFGYAHSHVTRPSFLSLTILCFCFCHHHNLPSPPPKKMPPSWPALAAAFAAVCFLYTIANIVRQIFPNKKEPPVIFHLVPWLGSAVTYGKDPYKFLFACREKVWRSH